MTYETFTLREDYELHERLILDWERFLLRYFEYLVQNKTYSRTNSVAIFHYVWEFYIRKISNYP